MFTHEYVYTGLLRTWVQHMERGYRKFRVLSATPAAPSKAGQAATPAVDGFPESLCTYMQHAITAASGQILQPQQPAAQSLQSKPSVQQQAATSLPFQPAAPQTASGVLVLAKTVTDFVGAVVASTSDMQHAATARRALKLAQSLVETLQQQRCSVPAELTIQMLELT